MTQFAAINSLKSGISRLRTKGGASNDGLYDLLNGYVTLAGTIVSRPGTVEDATLPEGTRGLCAFRGGMVVFSHEAKVCPAGYTCEVLWHPESPELAIKEIHYAGPMLGYLYVVAEFVDGKVFHYWLEGYGNDWAANHVYGLNEVIEPGNGLAYRATRLNPAAQVWDAGAPRTVGDKREPTVFNNYSYEVIDTTGTNPHSGDVEPAWVAEDGAVVYEEVDNDPTLPGTNDPGTTLPPDVPPKYGNPGGSKPPWHGVGTQVQ